MKEIKDWRNWIKCLLLTGGIFSLMYACGEPSPDMTLQQWFVSLLCSLGVSAACFFGLYILISVNDTAEDNE